MAIQKMLFLCLRTLIENLIESAFIAKFPNDAEKYIDFGLKAQAYRLKQIRKSMPKDDNLDLYFSVGLQEAKLISEIQEDVKLPKKGMPTSWHPKYKNLRDRSIQAGLPSFYYDILYRAASRYIHGSSDWMIDFGTSAKDERIGYKGDSGESALAISVGCMVMIEMLKIMNGCLNLSLDTDLISLIEKHDEMVEKEHSTLEK